MGRRSPDVKEEREAIKEDRNEGEEIEEERSRAVRVNTTEGGKSC